MKKLFSHFIQTSIISICACIVTATSFAGDFGEGQYIGKWKDDIESWSGQFILVLESVTEENISGSIQFKNAGNCRFETPFQTDYSGDNNFAFNVKTPSNCGYFDVTLAYADEMFSGTYKDILGKGKLIKVKAK